MDTTVQPGSCKGRPNYPTDFKLHLAQRAQRVGITIAVASDDCRRAGVTQLAY